MANKVKPNIIVIMTDQQRADLCRRRGYALDTTPFMDELAGQGADFPVAYTAAPVCGPARVSLFTGRYPSVHGARTNANIGDARYSEDLVDVLRGQGYRVGLSGKNHSHITGDRWDWQVGFGHDHGGEQTRTEEQAAFDSWLHGLHHMASHEPTPFPLECQFPYRIVTHAQHWISQDSGRPAGAQTAHSEKDDTNGSWIPQSSAVSRQGTAGSNGFSTLSQESEKPFFLWMSFPEPHNPFQVPEPYYSMFSPESLPAPVADESRLQQKGERWTWLKRRWDDVCDDFPRERDRTRANYHGMLRLIDDQVKRFVTWLEETGRMENTLIVFTSDHGDFVGEYGLIRKGPDLPECLARIPFFVVGPGVEPGRYDHAYVNLCDIMPTLCDAAGATSPMGNQGRSLWPLLRGSGNAENFQSVYAEHGLGGRRFTPADMDGQPKPAEPLQCTFDCLNNMTQTGATRMVRMGDWKLIADETGRIQLYNVVDDPAELNDRAEDPSVREPLIDLQQELITWCLRMQDPLPEPRGKYRLKHFS